MLGLSKTSTVKLVEEENEGLKKDNEALRDSLSRSFRVGTLDIEPARLTTRLRRLVPDIRVDLDREKIVVYSEHILTEEEYNTVAAHLPFTLDRT